MRRVFAFLFLVTILLMTVAALPVNDEPGDVPAARDEPADVLPAKEEPADVVPVKEEPAVARPISAFPLAPSKRTGLVPSKLPSTFFDNIEGLTFDQQAEIQKAFSKMHAEQAKEVTQQFGDLRGSPKTQLWFNQLVNWQLQQMLDKEQVKNIKTMRKKAKNATRKAKENASDSDDSTTTKRKAGGQKKPPREDSTTASASTASMKVTLSGEELRQQIEEQQGLLDTMIERGCAARIAADEAVVHAKQVTAEAKEARARARMATDRARGTAEEVKQCDQQVNAITATIRLLQSQLSAKRG
ncbi:MAG: hypothetical protein M1826_000853 [Phylliscum demangeonii]|nr:MAG: hypothetical protein M1826_000853 [Phylliscum demangeonii]